ncbi:YmgD family protein, partial [Escherichia sp. R-CC3]
MKYYFLPIARMVSSIAVINSVCAKDPQMLLITAIDDTMR